MYSEFLFAAEVNYIADSVVSIFSMLNISDVDFFSFSEMIIQRPLTFKALIIFFFHDS